MIRVALVAALAACGSKPAPAPSPPAPVPPDAPALSPTVTCTDVGVILGGPYNSDPAQERAAFDRDAAIAKACEADRWSTEVRECIGSTTHPSECLQQLPEAARTAYEQIPGREGHGDHGADLGVPEVTCEAAVAEPAHYPPALDDGAPERAWVLRERRTAIVHECDHGWSAELKACLQDAGSTSDVALCMKSHGDPGETHELVTKLGDLTKLGAKIAAAKKKPATIGCKQVVAAHYSDAKWKGKATTFDAKERKRLIKDSRDKMLKTCTADAWNDTLRACIVVGGESTCFESQKMALSWGYPAAGTVKSMGIAECDAYRAAIQRILTCDKMDPTTRDALGKAFEQMQAHMAGMSAAEKSTVATSCKAGADSLAQIAAAEGC